MSKWSIPCLTSDWYGVSPPRPCWKFILHFGFKCKMHLCNSLCYYLFQILFVAWSWLGHRTEWKSLETALTFLHGCLVINKLGLLHVSKVARPYLFSKSFSLFLNTLKCLLLREAMSNVLFFLSTPSALCSVAVEWSFSLSLVLQYTCSRPWHSWEQRTVYSMAFGELSLLTIAC